MEVNSSLTNNCSCGSNIIQQSNQNFCEQCTFQLSLQKSEQIMRLRQKLQFYSKQQNDLVQLCKLDQTTQLEKLLKPIENQLQRQMISFVQAQKQIDYLKKQLLQLNKEIEYQVNYGNQQNSKTQGLISEINLQKDKILNNQKKYMDLLKFYQLETLWKNKELNKFKSVLQKTNFVSIIYSINFDENAVYLNGQKIFIDNCWKVIQILAFYQQKYQNQYASAVQISIESMSIIPCLRIYQEVYPDKLNQISQFIRQVSIKSQYIDPIQINCDDQQKALQDWIPFASLQMKNLFEFLKKQSGIGSIYKLKYEVVCNGQFQVLKGKKMSILQKFNFTIKYLLSGIEQINRMEFFAEEKRLQNKKKFRQNQQN